MHNEDHYIERARATGADEYVLKDNVDELIREPAREVLAGRVYLCNEVRRKL